MLAFDADFSLGIPISADFGFQANGVFGASAAMPSGIADRIRLDGAGLAVTLKQGDTPPTENQGKRSECYTVLQPGGEWWWSVEFMVMRAEWPITSTPFAISTLPARRADDSVLGFTPIANQSFWVVENSVVAIAPILPEMLGQRVEIGRCPLIFDKWNTITGHIKWDTTKSGLREYFYNGESILRQFNVSTRYGLDVHSGSYVKFGIYNVTGAEVYGDRTIHFRRVKIWKDEPLGYTRAMGAVPTVSRRALLLGEYACSQFV